MKKISLIVVASAALFASCKKNDDDKSNIFKGPEVTVHAGKAWTWVELDKSGKPLRVAVSINDAALNSVPVGSGSEMPAGHDMSDMSNNLTLNFHQKASATPFKHVGLDWNPSGHEPQQIYGKPHFDFHFYEISEAERMAIPPYEVDSAKFNNWPAAAYFPPTYHNFGGGVPMMGAHWLDVTSPELSGAQPFTQTFIYGSYNGKVTFYEPMITLEFLKNTANFERAIPQPSKFQVTGYYPTTLRIVKHDGVTEIILDGLTYRQAS